MDKVKQERSAKEDEAKNDLMFNALGLFYFNLLDLMRRKTEYSIRNEYDDWCDSLRNILVYVSWRMKQDLSESLMQRLNMIDKQINSNKLTNTTNLNRFSIKEQLYKIDLEITKVIGDNFLKNSGKVSMNGIGALKQKYSDVQW